MSLLSNYEFYVVIILSVFCLVSSLHITKKAFLVLQLEDYRNFDYFISFKNIFKGHKKYFVILLCLTAFSLFLNNLFVHIIKIKFLNLFAIMPFLAVVLISFVLFKEEFKVGLKYTKRLKRLLILFCILYFLITVLSVSLSVLYLPFIRFSLVCIMPLISFLILPLANLFLNPVENIIKNNYKKKAIKKLKDYTNLIKIGITGSFGKTSTKFILEKILSQKYNVCTTPKSYNTSMGIVKVVLNDLKPYHDVLITEMGANRKNDIRELCDIVNPSYGIITAVGTSHLRTFKTMENLKKTKYQLVENVSLRNGEMIFNLDNEIVSNFYNKCTCSKLCVSINNFKADIFAIDIKYTLSDTAFTLVTPSGKVHCQTSLIGECNLQDILLASALAFKLNVDLNDIKTAISMLKPVPHRLEIKQFSSNYIIDDSFNSNLQGAINSLNVLNMFKGIKIVVTPGIVELGKLSKDENFTLGKEIAKVADVCIIVNETNKKALREGINGKIKTFVVNSLKEVNSILKQLNKNNYCILYENDLPDNYI